MPRVQQRTPFVTPPAAAGPVCSARRRRFEAAVRPHLDELYGTAVRFTRSPSDADDLLQEAMTRAWAFWHRFEEGTNARAWLHRILRNTFINGYRKRKRERRLLGEVQCQVDRRPHWNHQDAEARTDGFGDEVEAALETLPNDFRTVVLLVDLADRSYQEAADEIGCPIGTVMSRLHRGRRMLQQQLRAYAEVEGYIPVAA